MDFALKGQIISLGIFRRNACVTLSEVEERLSEYAGVLSSFDFAPDDTRTSVRITRAIAQDNRATFGILFPLNQCHNHPINS